MYTVKEIVKILGVAAPMVHDHAVEHLLIDSRKAYAPAVSLFFALSSSRRNGHDFIGELYQIMAISKSLILKKVKYMYS